jgi:hypothetical protein
LTDKNDLSPFRRYIDQIVTGSAKVPKMVELLRRHTDEEGKARVLSFHVIRS